HMQTVVDLPVRRVLGHGCSHVDDRGPELDEPDAIRRIVPLSEVLGSDLRKADGRREQDLLPFEQGLDFGARSRAAKVLHPGPGIKGLHGPRVRLASPSCSAKGPPRTASLSNGTNSLPGFR